VPDGFDVRPETLRRGAADLRSDAGALDGVRQGANSAAQQAAGAAGSGPLSEAVSGFADGLGRALDAARRSIEDSANALDAAGAQYLTSDGSASSPFSGAPLPGLDPPR
jgi:hypothetical protein